MRLFDKFKRDKQTETHCHYFEWDEKTFILPKEYELNSSSDLADALSVFYLAGGYDFFNVIDPKYYASQWLDFMGELYVAITEEVYVSKKKFKNPLTKKQKSELLEQGVPDIFVVDLNC